MGFTSLFNCRQIGIEDTTARDDGCINSGSFKKESAHLIKSALEFKLRHFIEFSAII